MEKTKRYSTESRERAVQLLSEQECAHASQWAAILSVAEKIGCSAETLLTWERQTEHDQGTRHGLTTNERERLKQFKKANKELMRANEILRLASAY